MRRPATQADVERWKAVIAKVTEAKNALREADVLVGQAIPTCDGNDTRSFDIIRILSDRLERARMAVANVEHPVAEHWAGGPKDKPYTSLSWLY